MRELNTILIFILMAISYQSTQAQDFQPTMLILSPSGVEVPTGFQKEVDAFNTEIEEARASGAMNQELSDEELAAQPDNMKIILVKQLEFANSMDYYSTISSMSEMYLQYRFYERFQNLLIYAVPEKSTSKLDELKELAGEHKVQYVLSYPELVSQDVNGTKQTAIRVQLYDNVSSSLLIDQVFTGDDKNPGFEFACETGTLACTFNNVLSQSLAEVINVVASNDPTIKREQQLALNRYEELMESHYPQKPKTEITSIIKGVNSEISVEPFYHGLMNDDESKFVGFFAELEKNDFGSMKEKKDKNVQILTDDVTDLDNVPSIYGYIVAGVKHESKWYVKQSHVTYFDSESFEDGKKQFFNSLQSLNFFKPNSTDFNPEFWETGLFAKVEDLSKKDDFEQYGATVYARDERENKSYIGQYEIVADHLKADEEKRGVEFKTSFSERLDALYTELKKSGQGEYSEFKPMSDKYTLIFPIDRSVVLNPIKVTDSSGKQSLRFFLMFPDKKDFYEWTHLEPLTFEKDHWHYGSEVIEQMGKVTNWNFGYKSLNDQEFWNDYVLKKSSGEYEFLKKLN